MIQKIILSPFSISYFLASKFHKIYLTNSEKKNLRPPIPLIVIGGLRAGGAGKTSVTLELTRIFTSNGLKVAIMVNWLLNKNCRLQEIEVENQHWSEISDEALLIKKKTSAKVMATRNRLQTWRNLSAEKKYDVILSDDGFQDPRLRYAIQLVLIEKEKKIKVWDLIPGGMYRETSTALKRADFIINKPLLLTQQALLKKNQISVFRRLIIPVFLFSNPECILLCGLGDNRGFIKDCITSGLRPLKIIFNRDHKKFSSKTLTFLSQTYPGIPLVMTEKDFIKLEPDILSLPIHAVSEEITIPKNTVELLIKRINSPKSGQIN